LSASRVAIVTGGSRGIGRAVALALAARGDAVVVGFASNGDEADQVVAEIERANGRAVAVAADVADEVEVGRLFDRAEAEFGGIDVVVHAAGRMTLAPLAEMELDALDAMIRTNLRGTFVVDQAAVRRLRSGGSIVNFSSSVLGRVLPSYTGYAATKGGVEAMTFILATELRGRDLNVNAVAPGPTATDMFLDGKTDEQIAFFEKAAPLERLGTPEDIAAVVAFLTSSDGHWINGQTIRANGGVN
jgi:3-oxoacyl-[acyl-carrier protein] reductase